MGAVKTNNVQVIFAVEQTPGVLPGSPSWEVVEFNTLPAFGNEITTVARDPISKNRQRRKGTVTDLDSSVSLDTDITMSGFENFMEGFMFANFTGGAVFPVTDVTATGYTVASGGALATDTLIFARGFTNAANNGLKPVTAGSTATEIKASGLVLEASPPANAIVEVAGVRGATSDLQIDASGDLISTALDFTTLPIVVGQTIWIGGEAAGNQFATAADIGWARIVSIVTNKIVLTNTRQAFTVDTGTGKNIDVYFGRSVQNVPTDDPNFANITYQFEADYPDLEVAATGTEGFEYAIGNNASELALQFPLASKATMSVGFIGLSTDDFTLTQKTNADSPLDPNKTEAFNTTNDFFRLRTDQDGLGLTSCFKDVTVTLNNNLTPEKCIGTLGANSISFGNFNVDLEMEALFEDGDVITAITDNRAVSLDFGLQNDDGGFFIDIPSMTFGGGARGFPVNESVTISLTGEAFQDPVTNASLIVSVFPFLPNLPDENQ